MLLALAVAMPLGTSTSVSAQPAESTTTTASESAHVHDTASASESRTVTTQPTTPAPASQPPAQPQPAPASPTAAQPAPVDPGWGAPAPAPAPAVAAPIPPSPRRRAKRGSGMMIAGYTVFGTAWLLSAFVGAGMMDMAENRPLDVHSDQMRAFGQRLMIPIGGPFAAALVAPSATGALMGVMDGLAQVAGLSLGIAGTVLYARARREQRLAFRWIPGAHGGSVQLGLRF